jgi:hypothetical protein
MESRAARRASRIAKLGDAYYDNAYGLGWQEEQKKKEEQERSDQHRRLSSLVRSHSQRRLYPKNLRKSKYSPDEEMYRIGENAAYGGKKRSKKSKKNKKSKKRTKKSKKKSTKKRYSKH